MPLVKYRDRGGYIEADDVKNPFSFKKAFSILCKLVLCLWVCFIIYKICVLGYGWWLLFGIIGAVVAFAFFIAWITNDFNYEEDEI